MRAYELRLTEYALEDLTLDPALGRLPADAYADQHAVVEGFVTLRGQHPTGQETTTLPLTRAIVYNLHVGRHRGLTWHDRRHGVVWLLGVGWHEQGARDDAYEVLKDRDPADRLFPTSADYRNLAPSSARFAYDLQRSAKATVQRALEEPGRELTTMIGGVLRVSVLAECVRIDNESSTTSTSVGTVASRGTIDARSRLLQRALTYPEAWEDHPWGESVVKVRKKVFVFLGVPDTDHFGCSVKLPESGPFVLAEDFAEPTGYGLGKAGWVSLTFARDDRDVPLDLLFELIDESYRAVAPKTLVKQLDAAGPGSA